MSSQVIVGSVVTVKTAKGEKMKTENGLDVGGDQGEPNKVHRVVNKLWQEHIDEEQGRALISAAMNQLNEHVHYRLMYPLLCDRGVVYYGVTLVARCDLRTKSLSIEMAPGATHLVMCLLFKNESEWNKQGKQLNRLWPEQADFPSMVFSEQ